MTKKLASAQEAIARIPDGASIMIGGFGAPGTPFILLQELQRQGKKNLTIIKNDANEDGMGISTLIAHGMVKKLITTHIGLSKIAMQHAHDKLLEVELVPQGIFAERIRCGGVGIDGFLTDIGLGTYFGQHQQKVTVDGRTLMIETPIRADFALLHTHRSDTYGNHVYDATSRNFCPLMAMAAKHRIIETRTLCETGEMNPETVHVSGMFVDAIVLVDKLTEHYGIIKR